MHQERIARIRRTSQVLKYVTFVIVLLFAATYVVAFIIPEAAVAVAAAVSAHTPLPPLTTSELLVVFSLGAVPFALFLTAIATVGELFGAFHRGKVLCRETGALLGQVGFFILAAQVAAIFSSAAAGAYVSQRTGAGELSIVISSTDAASLLFGCLMVVIGWVVAEAADVADENRQFV